MKRPITIFIGAVVLFILATGTGLLLGQSADDRTGAGTICTGWVFEQNLNQSGAAEGYMLCTNTGELWMVNGAKKKLVRE